MSSRTIWKCDGCDSTIETPSVRLPEGWAKVDIRIGYEGPKGGGGGGTINADLCSFCQSRLDKQIDPRRWPRQVIDSGAAQAAMDQKSAAEGAKT